MENELTRTRAQEIAMTAIYDALNYIYMNEEVPVEDIVSGLTATSYEDADLFVKKCLVHALLHLNDIIPLFQANMPKWKFQRLDRIEQAILLLASTHYFYVEEDVAKAVIINNAVELAKKFLEPNDYKFVNAVLDKTLPARERK